MKIITNQIIAKIKSRTSPLSLEKLFPNNVVVVHSYSDWTNVILHVPAYRQKLHNLGLLQYSSDVHFLLSRLFLQPSKEITAVIHKTLTNRRHDFSKCIGLQIRMGGQLAVTKENKAFLKVQSVVQSMKNISKQYHNNEPVYLSTDSRLILRTIVANIGNHSIIQSNAFTIGHSSSHFNKQKKVDGMRRGICDVILASHCKPLYLTYSSSFGRLIYWLSINPLTYIINKSGEITFGSYK